MADTDLTLTVGLDTKSVMQSLQDLKREATRILTSVQQEVDRAGRSSSNNGINNTTTDMRRLERSVQDVSDALNRLSTESHLQDLANQARNGSVELQQLASEYIDVVNEQDRVSESIRELKREMEDTSDPQVLIVMESQLQTLQTDYDNLRGRIRELTIELNELPEDAWGGVQQGAEDLTNQVEVLTARVAELETQLRAVQEQGNDNGGENATEEGVEGFTQGLAGGIYAGIINGIRSFISQSISNFTNRIRNAIAHVVNLVKSGVAKVKGIIFGLFKGIISAIKQMLPMLGALLSFKAFMGAFSKLKSMIMTGFKDIYNQDEKFKRQIDTIKQQILDINVALAKALMPAVQALLPYIKQFLDWIIALIGKLSSFISTITGIKAYTKAIKGLGGAAEGAGKSLSKLDELNVLNSGGQLTPDAGSIPDPKEVESLYDFIKIQMDKIKELLQSIDWDFVYEKARAFASKLAGVINTIADPSFWAVIGSTLAKVGNTIVQFFDELADRLKFKDIGKSIFEFLWHLFDDFDMPAFVRTVQEWADGIWETIYTIFTSEHQETWNPHSKGGAEAGKTTLTQKIVNTIISGLKAIDWNDIKRIMIELGETIAKVANDVTTNTKLARELGAAVGNIIDSIIKLFTSALDTYNFKGLGASVGTFFTALFEQVKPQDLVEAAAKLVVKLFKAISIALSSTYLSKELKQSNISALDILDAIIKFIFSVNQLEAGNPLPIKLWIGKVIGMIYKYFNSNNMTDEDKEKLKKIGENILLGILAGAILPVVLIKNKLTDLLTNIIKALKKLFKINSPSEDEDIQDIGKNIVLGVLEGFNLVDFAQKMTEWWDKNIAPWFTLDRWKTLADNIRAGIVTKWNEFRIWWTGSITGWWNNNVVTWFTLDRWKGIADNIRAGIVAKWNETVLWFTGNVGRIVDRAKDILSYKAFSSIGDTISNALKDTIGKGIEYIKGLWEDLKKAVQAGLSTVIKVQADTSDAMSSIANLTGSANDLAEALNDATEATKDFNKENDKLKKDPGTQPIFVPATNSSGSHYNTKKIPKMASGGVVPPWMASHLAIIGDNNSETEVVSPLSTMKQAMIEALTEMGGFANGDITVNLTVDGKVLAQTIVKQDDLTRRSRGVGLFGV